MYQIINLIKITVSDIKKIHHTFVYNPSVENIHPLNFYFNIILGKQQKK